MRPGSRSKVWVSLVLTNRLLKPLRYGPSASNIRGTMAPLAPRALLPAVDLRPTCDPKRNIGNALKASAENGETYDKFTSTPVTIDSRQTVARSE